MLQKKNASLMILGSKEINEISSEKGGSHGLTRFEFCTNYQLIHFQN